MIGRGDDRSRLLRWYPHAWRERYGEEMLAVIDDELGDGDAGLRLRLSLARHGLSERARGAGLLGPGTSPDLDRRRGALMVFIAWASFIVAGAGYAKAAEHFDAAVPVGTHVLPQVAYDVVLAFGVLGGIIVLVGAAVAVPGFVRLLLAGEWPARRGHVVRAVAVSAITVTLTIPLVLWAHQLSDHQRNGGSVVYGIAVLAWVGLIVASLACWTAVAVAVGRRVDLSPRALRIESGLALALAAVMMIVAVSTVAWWTAMAAYAPAFLTGQRAGGGSTLFNLPLLVTVAVMLVGLAVSSIGVRRIIHARVA